MWGFEELIAKAKLYFGRAANHDEVDDEFALWLLLGLEFLLRAPLAQLHPSLLAQPDGDSILHAAGIVKPNAQPRSVQIKTVVDRLEHVVVGFGSDRQRDAIFLTNLRNRELHTGDAALANVPEDQWLPRFLSVVEAICEHLEMSTSDLLGKEIVGHAEALAVKVDRAIEREVAVLIEKSKYLFSHLTESELEARTAKAKSANSVVLGPSAVYVTCPACGNKAKVKLASGRTTRSKYNEDDGEITYQVVKIAESMECLICDLRLANTAQVTAAGIPRVQVVTFSEDRYEGWEDVVDTSDLIMRDYGEDYGND